MKIRSDALPATWLILILLSQFLLTRRLSAQEETEAQADGPWISSVAWLSDTELIGTRSQGLLLRPAQVVKASTSSLQDLNSIGESSTSLWTTLPIGDDVLSTDYKGGVHVFGDESSQAFASKIDKPVRWIRCLTKVDDSTVLAGTEDGLVLVLSLTDRTITKAFETNAAAVFDISMSNAGDRVATTSGDGKVKVFEYPSFQETCEMKQGSEAIWSVVFTQDDRRLVTGGSQRRIQLWDIESCASICTISKASNWVTDLIGLPDSTLVVAACMDGRLVVVDTESLTRVESVDAASSAIWCASLSPSGRKIALGTRKHGFAIVDTAGWQEKASDIRSELATRQPPKPVRAK